MNLVKLLFLVLLLPATLNAQVVTLNGVSTKIASGLQVKVNGDIKSSTGSILHTDGTLTIVGSLSNTGTAKGSGTISSSGDLTNKGLVSPGNDPVPGTLSVIGNYTNGTGALEVKLGGVSTPGTSYDQLSVTGKATLSGSLNVSLVNGFTLVPGQVFTILTASSVAGTFAATNLPDGMTVQYNANNVKLLNCTLPVAEATSAIASGVLGPGNCNVQVMLAGTGSSFVLQNAGIGFTYSYIYRKAGSYSLAPVSVTKPGIYTFTVYSTNACGQTNSATRTIEISGTACQ